MANVTSVTKFFPVAKEGFTTTAASSIGSGAATVPLNSVTGYTNGDTVVMVIDPGDATKKQAFTGVVDTSGVQITGVVWTEGTNTTHAAGATVVDYVAATHMSMVTKGLLVEHNQAGTHAPTIITSRTEDTAPVDADYILTYDSSATGLKKALRSNFLGQAWASWTPTLANLTLGNGTVAATYVQIGKTVHFKWKFTLGTTSAVGTSPTFTLPVTALAAENERGQFLATYQDTGLSITYGYGFIATTTTCGMYCWNASGTYVAAAGVTATVPVTFGSTDVIMVFGTYEAA